MPANWSHGRILHGDLAPSCTRGMLITM